MELFSCAQLKTTKSYIENKQAGVKFLSSRPQYSLGFLNEPRSLKTFEDGSIHIKQGKAEGVDTGIMER